MIELDNNQLNSGIDRLELSIDVEDGIAFFQLKDYDTGEEVFTLTTDVVVNLIEFAGELLKAAEEM
jgi:hypothetical protein